jgi:hypothetical protein
LVSTQTPLHFVAFARHMHAPVVHSSPEVQALPQLPQWSWSVLRSTQVPPHSLGVAGGHAPLPPDPAAPLVVLASDPAAPLAVLVCTLVPR